MGVDKVVVGLIDAVNAGVLTVEEETEFDMMSQSKKKKNVRFKINLQV